MNLNTKIDIDKIFNKFGINSKIRRYILSSLISVMVIWLFIPPILGYYFFIPDLCLDNSRGTIILDGKNSLVCTVGGIRPAYVAMAGKATYSNSYISEIILHNEILTFFFANGEIASVFELKNKFFWIAWRELEPSDGDNSWHYGLPLYEPIAFFQTLAVRGRYLREKKNRKR